jgi:hypothetical protein
MSRNSFVNPIFAAALVGFTPAGFSAAEIQEQDDLQFLDDIRLPVEVNGQIEQDCLEMELIQERLKGEADFDFITDYCREPATDDYYPSDWF